MRILVGDVQLRIMVELVRLPSRVAMDADSDVDPPASQIVDEVRALDAPADAVRQNHHGSRMRFAVHLLTRNDAHARLAFRVRVDNDERACRLCRL